MSLFASTILALVVFFFFQGKLTGRWFPKYKSSEWVQWQIFMVSLPLFIGNVLFLSVLCGLLAKRIGGNQEYIIGLFLPCAYLQAECLVRYIHSKTIDPDRLEIAYWGMNYRFKSVLRKFHLSRCELYMYIVVLLWALALLIVFI